ncbi:hypothetical protein MnTg04_00262 [bacterium MnTg04]|nr:hypothetical protein MnTg04_00262 [bacterium MnTg04]
MDKKDLPAAAYFAHTGFLDQRVIPLTDKSLDRVPFGGWRRDQRHFPQPADGHVQRARDWRGGQGQHIDFGAQGLEPFLVAHAKSLFFIDNDQAQVGESDLWLEQAMRANHDIDDAAFQFRDDFPGLLAFPEPGQHFDLDRPVGEAIAESLVVLLCKQGRRHQ